MKTLATYILAAVLAFGAPAALGQEADGASAEAAAQPEQSASVQRTEKILSDGVAGAQPAEALPAQRTDQILYKGVVGNLLEAVPMDPEQRVGLQRGNAVVSAPMTARSLALLIGITNPVVMIGGLIWGIWAASRIESPPQQAKAPAEPTQARADISPEAIAGD